MNSFKIISVNISKEKGIAKIPVDSVDLNYEGIAGDAHSGKWHRQVSLMSIESIDAFSEITGKNFNYGDFAENITTKGIKLNDTKPGDRLCGKNVELLITQIGKKCHGNGCSIYQEVGACIMPTEGIFAKVIKPGRLKAGDRLECKAKVYKIGVITLSTRASMGVYPDLSGPQIISDMENYAKSSGWNIEFDYHLVPDNKEMLNSILTKMIKSETDIIFTTGGTGIGPEDFTPEVVKPFFDKEIPGIMEYIRLKYGTEKPNVLVSRSIAGLSKESLIFTLPGSKKAVTEYMCEIVPLLEHLVYMKMGIDNH
ncbi:MAG: molybdenum cofactor synthesis domain-containing protein [Rikenellaceae bacterium]